MKMNLLSIIAMAAMATGVVAAPTPGRDMIAGIDSISTRSAWASKPEGDETTDETIDEAPVVDVATVEKRVLQEGETEEDVVDMDCCISTRSAWAS